jgi:hypothetical protein
MHGLAQCSEAAMRKLKRKVIQWALLLGAYILSYAVMSFCGGYRIVMSGMARPTGLAFGDTFVWQPRFGKCYPFRTASGEDTHHMDIFGAFYYPLACLDQSFIHHSRPYITLADNDLETMRIHPWPPMEQMHPVARKIIHAADIMQARYGAEIDAARARKDHAEVSRIRQKMRKAAEKEFGIKI